MMSWFWTGLSQAFGMFWETFWALVLGFGISGALQVFVSKEQMSRAFGRAGLRQVALATGLGAASSSCSYAAAAAGRSAFQKGAALVPMLAFMFASTNLVIELGALLWLLMGWHFVLAEVVGSFVLIGVMWLLIRLFFPAGLEAAARQQSQEAVTEHGCCGSCDDAEETDANRSRWTQVATAFVSDWRMLAKEIALGFLLAGFIAALVPPGWWRGL
ncbi:MAG TPA: permease, partial [Chthoniobacterales bacterium]|nr:permease [Chthoniobacterales bacterium]